jgi:protease II
MAVIGNLYYYIRLIETFRTIELRVCNAMTGKGDRILYREENPERDIYLWKTVNRTLYFKSSDPKTDDLYRIDGMNLIPLYKKSVMQMPLGLSAEGDDCVLIRNSRIEPWKAIGRPVSAWNFPKEEIRWVNLFSGHVITVNEGEQSIWYCAEKKRPILLCKLKVGSIEPNNWSTWENMLVESFIVNSPNSLPYLFNIVDHKICKVPSNIAIKRPMRFKPLEVHRFHTTSKDGTKVPYVIVHQKGIKPKAQFIMVYGAYGTITPVDWPYESWYPLLSRKWAMVYAMVRGGGDIDERWTEVARRNNRHVVVDDFEAIIRNSQRKLELGPDKTVIYGRSAGGLPIGAIVSRFPDGTLVGAAFTEVPYVDVLRTSSNPKLPLTIGEFKEFGNPKERILNFKELLSVSPIDTLPPGGAPGVFVLSRVGLLDKQVLAYESFKWIQRLRGEATPDESHPSNPRGKYVTIERNEAHQYSYKVFSKCRAHDLAIMNAWVDGTLRYE